MKSQTSKQEGIGYWALWDALKWGANLIFNVQFPSLVSFRRQVGDFFFSICWRRKYWQEEMKHKTYMHTSSAVSVTPAGRLLKTNCFREKQKTWQLSGVNELWKENRALLDKKKRLPPLIFSCCKQKTRFFFQARGIKLCMFLSQTHLSVHKSTASSTWAASRDLFCWEMRYIIFW